MLCNLFTILFRRFLGRYKFSWEVCVRGGSLKEEGRENLNNLSENGQWGNHRTGATHIGGNR